MNYISKHLTLAAILLSAISVSAQDAATALANAQKSYVSGNWKEAASAYEKACPMQPKEKQAECLLWNILALSQTGDAASFKKAGKRLDSLVQKVSPQESLYADLMMTSAQFRLYLGKYELAAQDLIHAIETSKPHHNVVLQKVCTAVKAKSSNEDLKERCELLKNPDSLAAMQKAKTEAAEAPAQAQPATTAPAVPAQAAAPAPTQATAPVQAAAPAQPTTQPAAQPAPATQTAEVKPAAESPKPAEAPKPAVEATKPAAPVAAQPAPAVQASAPAVAPAATPAPAAAPAADKPSEEYWILQLGAYSVKAYADLMVNNLKKQKIACTIVEQPRGEKILYLVHTGHFATKEAAIDFAADKLVKQKIEYQPLLRK
ncbi:Sporulation related domain-containing protein [Fibrobacter sp. UWH5]|uniref:SPOR domain-containing protein n=1 Tax=Fibrobacter sp. UWH5 TaxID=1896211 RepID=UPI00091BE1C2|nr:SPOR domain-containing protein [Fibrobacter sp. UWH5]SHK31932.1 Sporulation related domain-containing protein [Fibrobacter sp. UWH5]